MQVAQFSTLSPILLNVYMTLFADPVDSQKISYRRYVDDTQLHLKLEDNTGYLQNVSYSLFHIHKWIQKNWLCLNGNNIDILHLGPASYVSLPLH